MTSTKSKRGCGLPRSGSGLTGRPVAGRGSCRARAGAAAALKRPAAALDSSNKRSNGAARTANAERRWIIFFARTRKGATPARWDGWEGEGGPASLQWGGVAASGRGRGEARTGLVTRHRLLSLSPPPPLPPGRWAGQPVSLAKRALAPQQLWLAPPHSRACKAPRCTCSVQQGPPTRPCQAAVRPTPW